jgi:hypothetical protein
MAEIGTTFMFACEAEYSASGAKVRTRTASSIHSLEWGISTAIIPP